MTKVSISLVAVLLAFALVSTVSASGPAIVFPYDGKLVVTYSGSDASYNNEFGISTPGPLFLGKIHDVPSPEVYSDVGRCENGKEVVLYIKAPDGYTYLTNANGPDGVDHAKVTAEVDKSFTVGFEDWYGGGDLDYNDVFLNVACTQDVQDVIPTPEFPTNALPAALVVGLIGAILFVKSTKIN